MASLANLSVFLGIWLLLWLPIGIIVIWRSKTPLAYPVPAAQKLPLLLPLYILAPLAVWLFNRWWLQGTDLSYGLVWGSKLFRTGGIGFALGVVGVLLLTALQLGLGWRHINRQESNGQSVALRDRPWWLALALLPLALFIGGIEEWIFRGVVVDSLLSTLSIGSVVVLSSLIFAVSHLVWDGGPGIPQLPGLWSMGVVLWLARWVAGGGLGLAMGLHAGWIYVLAVVDTLNLLKPNPNAPSWLAGKPDQPLTGLADLSLLALTGGGLWWYSHGMGF
jgi:membrane protease YdiL (CAAX protease family)